MSDETWTKTHRETLEKLITDDQVGVPVREAELVAIRAALAEIADADAENARLGREIVRLTSQIAQLKEALKSPNPELLERLNRMNAKFNEISEAIVAAAGENAQLNRERDELQALVDSQATENAQQKVVIGALTRDEEIHVEEKIELRNLLQQAEAELRQARAALELAVDTIRTWHGMGMGKSIAEAWALYQSSPEMVQINAARKTTENP